MGAASSTKQISAEQQELESLATSTGSLPTLQKAFDKLADPQTKSIPLKSLQECFCFNFKIPISEASHMPENFPKLLSNLGTSIVDLFFMTDKEGVDWIQFLRGYIKCCGRMPTSTLINILCKLYAAASSKAGLPLKVEFESDDIDCKISGYFTSRDVFMFLPICWIMSQSSRMLKLSQGQAKLEMPDTNHLLLSAVTSCAEDVKGLNVWDCSISDMEVQLSAQKFHMWVLSTVPTLGHCFNQYVHARIRRLAISEDNLKHSNLPISDICFTESPNKHLLTCGRAWAISLTLRSTVSEEVLNTCITGNTDGTNHNLLYSSSIHGRGLNRFWSNIEGYHGALLILVSASSGNIDGSDSSANRWVIGVLTEQGFENKDQFYGSSGHLYALSPIFHVFSPHGKEKNFVYSHLHRGRVYDPHPKPEGIGFGGTIGNERVFIDEGFARVTVRHHAVDKTYQPGSLVPNQGYLPLEASVLDVEVWGLGGQMAKKEQNAFQNREQLFTEQRRKVDLKTLGNWEDSPEKMMMGMVSDPNKPQREER
ncbi:Tld-domain containing nucleolar protein [Thalictrum thalictroides]|uniref:Tld-domain containing nucleolar protein n=1 Tax=Thalictrum thalictroides TaxID=46969 RepID=A0A7J6W5F5_THATH|nr:Tld-domain containing nucleolar protein [Thalictrum thalictroides]